MKIYKNEAGFSVISADTRLPEVLAYSDNGNIPQNIDDMEVTSRQMTGIKSIFKLIT